METLLGEEIRSDVRAAYAISGHTLSAGGKRLRPALVTLAARAVVNPVFLREPFMRPPQLPN